MAQRAVANRIQEPSFATCIGGRRERSWTRARQDTAGACSGLCGCQEGYRQSHSSSQAIYRVAAREHRNRNRYFGPDHTAVCTGIFIRYRAGLKCVAGKRNCNHVDGAKSDATP